MKKLPLALALACSLPLVSFAQSVSLPSRSDDKTAYEDRYPTGLFSSIVTAHGQEMVQGEARSFKIVPVKPSQTFAPDVPEIFVVFNLHQHDSEFKVYGRWVLERGDGMSGQVLGTDAMILMTEDESGYVSMKRPGAGWPIGNYKVQIFTGTGDRDMDPIGTLRFQVLAANTAP